MADVVFSSWGRNIVDNRKGGEAKSVSFKLPVTYDGERPLSAFIGWDGIILYNKDVDIPAMVAEYMKRVQTRYVCGKCTPGKKGTRVIMDALLGHRRRSRQRAAARHHPGRGGYAEARKCTLCPTSSVPVLRCGHPFPRRLPELHPRRQEPLLGIPLHREVHRALHGQVSGPYRHPGLHRGGEGLPLRRLACRGARFHAAPLGLRQGLPAPLRDRMPQEAGGRADQHHDPQAQPPPISSGSTAHPAHGPQGEEGQEGRRGRRRPARALRPPTTWRSKGTRSPSTRRFRWAAAWSPSGIPPYRQPRNLLQRDIDIISALGVEILYNTKVGKDVSLDELRAEVRRRLPGARRPPLQADGGRG